MAKQPQDHKTAKVAFTWETPDGDTINLPSLNAITAGMIRKHRKLDDMDFMFTILEEVVPAEELAKVDNLGVNDVERMFSEWQKSDGATVPQS